ncbi:hypothetical protein IWW50_005486, partial [Coemansia erecta]
MFHDAYTACAPRASRLPRKAGLAKHKEYKVSGSRVTAIAEEPISEAASIAIRAVAAEAFASMAATTQAAANKEATAEATIAGLRRQLAKTATERKAYAEAAEATIAGLQRQLAETIAEGKADAEAAGAEISTVKGKAETTIAHLQHELAEAAVVVVATQKAAKRFADRQEILLNWERERLEQVL